jgi:hypothetical protein
MFSLQVLGAVAQLERSLISSALGGIKAAKARGKKPGNPGMRERQPERSERSPRPREGVCDDLIAGASMDAMVRRMRPHHLGRMLSACCRQRASVDRGSAARARRQARLTAHGGPCPPPLPAQDPEDRLMTLIAGIAMTDPSLSLRDIGAQLERMRERTPRGGLTWSASL